MLAAAGAEVLVNDLLEERTQTVVGEIEAAGGRARSTPFDVTDYDAVKAAVDEAGPVDILVNNAGNAGSTEPHGQLRPVDLRRDHARLVGPLHQDQLLRRPQLRARRVAGDDRGADGVA